MQKKISQLVLVQIFRLRHFLSFHIFCACGIDKHFEKTQVCNLIEVKCECKLFQYRK